MTRSMSGVEFGEAIAFVPSWFLSRPAFNGIRMVPLDDVNSAKDYSEFMFKRLLTYIRTEHVLVVQWDGFVVHPTLWQNHFLDFDFIGAPWPQFNDEYQVGNGGFSMRSRRLMSILQDARFSDTHPEDVAICRTYRSVLDRDFGMRFPTASLAVQFSVERQGDPRFSFGCHGLANMVIALASSELDAFVRQLPDDVYVSTEARGFVKNLLRVDRRDLAAHALMRRVCLQGWSIASMRLQLRIWMQPFTSFFSAL
jgi:hypothetical protein